MKRSAATDNISTTSALEADLDQFLGERKAAEHPDEEKRELRQANYRLARQLQRLREDRDEVVRAVIESVKTAAMALEIPSVPSPAIAKSRGNHREEQAIICVGDLQLAKVTPTYNTSVCERRMQTYAEAIRSIISIQRADHPVKVARVYMLGDIIEGELIFPHQPYQIDASLFTQLMVDGPRILINFLRTLLTFVDRVHCVCIPGNHGNIGGRGWKAYSPATNADRILYAHIQAALANEPRISWAIPYQEHEAAWYAVDYPWAPDTRGGNLLFHGHQIPNASSASVATVARRIWGWSSGGVPEPFDNVFYGHWHTPKYSQANRIKIICNGSTESTNTYAQERLSAIGQPVQFLGFTHPRRGITAHYWCELEREPVVSPQAYNLPAPQPLPPVRKARTKRG